MKQNLAAFIRCAVAERPLVLVCVLLLSCAVLILPDAAQAKSGAALPNHAAASRMKTAQQPHGTLSVLMVSDIHFEPFWDPGKAQLLAAAPVSRWTAILASAPSPDRQQRFAAMSRVCETRGPDTPYPLLASALEAMRSHAGDARFVTVSGDLLSHSFDCKYRAALPHSTPAAYRNFVEKTVNYVIGELYGAFPGVPVYVALGNNDTDCGDYRLDTHSSFLADAGSEVTRNFPASERAGALATFADGGYYSIALPAPIKNARLLVLNDIFMSKKYSTCSGRDNPAAAAAQIDWLAQQLAAARRDKEKVWVMSHIPPGVDLHSTVRKMDDICGGHGPSMFLSSEKMADTMAEYGDVVKLAIFAHTHMDELRVLEDDGSGAPTGANAAVKMVAVKMVASISPINGNHPTFTVAQIDPDSAALKDYRVFAASNSTGVNTAWNEEYDFRRSFHKAEFSSASVHSLVAEFAADPDARTEASREYIQHFSQGYLSPVLRVFWPQYVCTLSNHTKQTFRACVCSGVR